MQVKCIYAEKVLIPFHFTASKRQQIKCICTGAAPRPPLAEMLGGCVPGEFHVGGGGETGWDGVINSLKISLLRQLTATTVK